MSYFQQLLEASQFKIVGGSEYLWNSFGKDVRYLDIENSELNIQLDLIFNTQTQEVFQASLFMKDNTFRWLSPDYIDAYKKECYERDVDPRIAYDNVKYCDCAVFEDFLSKVKEAFETGTCDNKVTIQLDLKEEEKEQLLDACKDISLDDFVSQILAKEVEKITERMNTNWNSLVLKLKEDEIEVTKDNSEQLVLILEKNVQEIYDWIKSLNIKQVELCYSDKETANGLICFLKEKTTNNIIKYKFSDIPEN